MLQKHSIQTHVIYGLALDACVKDTSFDARALGFEVFLVQDLCRSVHPAQENNTISEMRTHGIQVIDSMVLKRALEKIKR